MKAKSKKILSLLLAILMLTLSLTACGGGDGEKTPDAPDVESSTPANPDAPGTEEGMVVVRYTLGTTWDNLNCLNPTSAYNMEMSNFLYSRPAALVSDGFEPMAATSWEMNEDYTAITFHLNPDLCFHDGEPVTADDWMFTVNLVTNPEVVSMVSENFNYIAGTDDTGYVQPGSTLGIDVIDEHTITVHFKSSMSADAFLENCCYYWYILPEHLLKDCVPADFMSWEFWSAPVGSGPCKFVSEQAGSQLVMDAVPNYPLGELQFDRLIVSVIDPSTAITALMSGESDYDCTGFARSDVESLSSNSNITIDLREGPGSTAFMLYNNNNLNQDIRKALDYAMDKQLIVDTLLNGDGEPAATALLSSNTKYFMDLYEGRQLEKAKALLASGGYDGRTIQMATSAGAREQQATVIASMWAEAGINVELNIGDTATCIGGMIEGVYDIVLISATSTNNPLWHASMTFTPGNFANIDPVPFAPLIDAWVGATTEEELIAAADEYTQFVYDYCGVSYVFHQFKHYPHASWLSGMTDIGMDYCWKWTVDRDLYFQTVGNSRG